MKQVFIDTNIFVRFFLGDNPILSKRAQGIISGCEAGQYQLVVSPAVLLELSWLLHSFYKQPKEQTVDILERIVNQENIHILEMPVTKKMLSIFKAVNIDLLDAYIGALMIDKKVTEIFTFDEDFKKIPKLKVLSPQAFGTQGPFQS